jgi:hypothetical protein
VNRFFALLIASVGSEIVFVRVNGYKIIFNRASGVIMNNRRCSGAEPPVTIPSNTSRASDDIIIAVYVNPS